MCFVQIGIKIGRKEGKKEGIEGRKKEGIEGNKRRRKGRLNRRKKVLLCSLNLTIKITITRNITNLLIPRIMKPISPMLNT